MKKSKKLLSVLLAMIMILSSMTMLASAAPANYKTAENLTGLSAYSPYGTVTRLSTEERTSILYDYLDSILKKANINMGQVFSLGSMSLTIDLRSLNALCETVDQVKSLKGNWLVGLAGGLLGIIADLNVDSWEADVCRDSDQLRVIFEITQLLYENRQLVSDVIESGNLDLGLVGSFVDLSAVKEYLADLPALIKGLIIPLLIRPDDKASDLKGYKDKVPGAGQLEGILDSFVQGIFSKPMNWTSYRETADGTPCDVNGDTTHGATVDLPTVPKATANYYVKGDITYKNADGQEVTERGITRYKYDLKTAEWKEDGKFRKTEELDGDGKGKGVYVYVPATGEGENLKYYTYGDEGYFLPNAKNISFSLMGESAAALLYKFIPPVFSAMAPVVLNGSVKRHLGEWFGAKYNYVGEANSDEVSKLPDAADPFFTQEQGDYLWEWSDYKVINGNHYYRYEDQIFAADLSNCNPYFDIINWNYKISGDFLDEFVPSINGTTVTNSAKGYSTVLQGLNDFLIKVVNTVLTSDITSKMTLTSGNNENLVANAKSIAQTVVKHSPASIFGENYATGYYELMTSADSSNQDILNGIAATIIGLVMPQMIIPSAGNLKGQNVGAILAAVVRELVTQLIPNHNYDALIYDSYNDKTFLAGKDNSYWLDVILTMGTDLGIHYLRNIADMGEDTDQWNGMKAAGWAESKTYAPSDLNEIGGVKPWEAKVDYIVDWALDNSYEWCWSMENFVNIDGLTIDPKTVQDPWVKLDKILNDLLPLKQIINCKPATGMTWLETVLRQNLVLAIVDLDIKNLTDLLIVPDGALRNTDVLLQIATIVKNLLNTLLYKVGSYTLLDEVSKVNRIDDLLNQTNLATVVRNLLGMIWPAIQKDYDIAGGAAATAKGTFARNGLLTTVLPIVNMFVGWTTDPQKFADPDMIFTNADNVSYFYTGAEEKLTVMNSASGMLLNHYDKSGKSIDTDDAYTITLNNITSSDGTITVNTKDSIAPGESREYTLNTTDKATERTVTLTVHYTFSGKDGQPLGGEQTKTVRVYVSDLAEQARTSQTVIVKKNNLIGTTVVNAGLTGPKGVFVNNRKALKPTIDDLTFTATNYIGDTRYELRDLSFTGLDTTYITDSGEIAALRGKYLENSGSQSAKFGTISEAKAESMASGTSFRLGSLSVTVRNNSSKSQSGSINFGNFFFADGTSDVTDLFNSENSLGRKASDYTAASWAAYDAAMNAAAAIAIGPKNTQNFATVYSAANIKKCTDDLDAAVKGLVKTTSANITKLETAFAEAEPDPEKDLNFQDYALFEYFQYEKQRTNARNMIKASTPPAAPENHIDGVWGNALTSAIANAQTNDQVKKAVNATIVEPTAEEVKKHEEAVAAFKAPDYSELEIEDQAAKLPYYKQFMVAKPKTVNKQFLDKEIEAANAQGYVEAEYSTDSWKRYTEALADAQAVSANGAALQSEVFDAKYELMVAQNELLEKAKSMKDSGYLDEELIPLINHAKAIIANYGTLYAVDSTKNITEDDAFVQLVRALGVEYKDVLANGKKHSGILYDYSALTFQAYDRVATIKNKQAVDAASDKLRDAIENFVCTVVLESKDSVTKVDQVVRYIQGITPNSLKTVGDLEERVTVSGAATPVYAVSKAGQYGTGARVELRASEAADSELYATYFVVIYGDVNGDGAVDAFDALEVDHANNSPTPYYMGDVYDDAADVNGDGEINDVDYGMIAAGAKCKGAISQVR